MTSIDSIVRSYLADKAAPTLHGYLPLLHYALEGFDELHYDVVAVIKTGKLTLNDIKVAKLPTDLLQLVRVAVKVGDRWEVLDHDNSISFHNTDLKSPNTRYDKRKIIGAGDTLTSDLSDYSLTNDRGKGHNYLGYYRIDKSSNELHFSADVTGRQIFIEYIGNASTPNAETMVTPLAKKYLNRYIGYKESWRKNGEASAETQARKIEAENELYKVHARESNLSLDTIANMVNQAYGFTNLR